jgi:hypothetical protein
MKGQEAGSNKEIFKDPDRLVELMQERVQNLTGLPIKINKRRAKKSIIRKSDSLRSLFQESKLADLWRLNDDERRRRIENFRTAYLRIIFDLPHEQDPLELLVSSLTNFFEADKKYTFLKSTKYSEYRTCLFLLVEKIYSDATKFDSIRRLLQSGSAEDLFETSQLAIKLSRVANLLQKDRQRLTEGTVEKYISAYRDIGAYFEKIVRILMSIPKILRGENAKLFEIRKYNTRNNVESLRTDSLFKKLLTPFNVDVWNASKHSGVIIMPSYRKIKFTDNKKSVTWKYETLKQQTCELYAAVHVLSHLGNALNLYWLQKHLSNSNVDTFVNPPN